MNWLAFGWKKFVGGKIWWLKNFSCQLWTEWHDCDSDTAMKNISPARKKLENENHKLKIVYLAHSAYQFWALAAMSWPPTFISYQYKKPFCCCRCCYCEWIDVKPLVHRQTSRQNHWSASKFKCISVRYKFNLFDQVTIAINASSSSLLLWCNRKLRNATKEQKKKNTKSESISDVEVGLGWRLRIQNG